LPKITGTVWVKIGGAFTCEYLQPSAGASSGHSRTARQSPAELLPGPAPEPDASSPPRWGHRSTGCGAHGCIASGELQNLLALEVGVELKVKPFQGIGGIDRVARKVSVQLFLCLAFGSSSRKREKLHIGPLSINGLPATGSTVSITPDMRS
jgi:hypothetical protein